MSQVKQKVWDVWSPFEYSNEDWASLLKSTSKAKQPNVIVHALINGVSTMLKPLP